MGRYIDVNKIRLMAIGAVDGDDDVLIALRDVKTAILQTPTEDVIDVVRCKNCIYYSEGLRLPTCINQAGLVSPNADGYCSYGKRKVSDYDYRETN